MAALTSDKWRATLKAQDPVLCRTAKDHAGFSNTNNRARKSRRTSGCPGPLSHLKEALGIVLPG